MLDSTLNFLAQHVTEYTVAGFVQRQYGNLSVTRKVTADRFRCGNGYIILAILLEKQFVNLMKALGREDALDDPRFADWTTRTENAGALRDVIEGAMRDGDPETWEKRLTEADVPCATVKGIDEIAGTCAAHGEAGVQYADSAREGLGLPADKWFVSGETYKYFADHKSALIGKYGEWEKTFGAWKSANPDKAKALQDAIERTIQLDDRSLDDELLTAFPEAMRKAHREAILTHRLRGEIIATRIANRMVNRLNIIYPFELAEEEGASPGDVANAFIVVERLFGLQQLWDELDRTAMDEQARLDLFDMLAMAARSHIADLMRTDHAAKPIGEIVAQLEEGVGKLTGDEEKEAEGKAQKNKGKAQDKVGQAKDKMRDKLDK